MDILILIDAHLLQPLRHNFYTLICTPCIKFNKRDFCQKHKCGCHPGYSMLHDTGACYYIAINEVN